MLFDRPTLDAVADMLDGRASAHDALQPEAHTPNASTISHIRSAQAKECRDIAAELRKLSSSEPAFPHKPIGWD